MEKQPTNFEQRWGFNAKKFGFTQIPNLLLRSQCRLGLTRSELLLLVHLISSMREDHSTVTASLEFIRKCSGMSKDTIHRAKRGLVAKEFCRMRSRKAVWRENEYDLSGTWMKLMLLARYEEENRIIYGTSRVRLSGKKSYGNQTHQ